MASLGSHGDNSEPLEEMNGTPREDHRGQQAARQKSALIDLARLWGVELSGMVTVEQLKGKCVTQATLSTPAEKADLVNFGAHAKNTYEDLLELAPDYATWVLATLKEEGQNCNYRLIRLVKWLDAETSRRTEASRLDADKGTATSTETDLREELLETKRELEALKAKAGRARKESASSSSNGAASFTMVAEDVPM